MKIAHHEILDPCLQEIMRSYDTEMDPLITENLEVIAEQTRRRQVELYVRDLLETIRQVPSVALYAGMTEEERQDVQEVMRLNGHPAIIGRRRVRWRPRTIATVFNPADPKEQKTIGAHIQIEQHAYLIKMERRRGDFMRKCLKKLKPKREAQVNEDYVKATVNELFIMIEEQRKREMVEDEEPQARSGHAKKGAGRAPAKPVRCGAVGMKKKMSETAEEPAPRGSDAASDSGGVEPEFYYEEVEEPWDEERAENETRA